MSDYTLEKAAERVEMLLGSLGKRKGMISSHFKSIGTALSISLLSETQVQAIVNEVLLQRDLSSAGGISDAQLRDLLTRQLNIFKIAATPSDEKSFEPVQSTKLRVGKLPSDFPIETQVNELLRKSREAQAAGRAKRAATLKKRAEKIRIAAAAREAGETKILIGEQNKRDRTVSLASHIQDDYKVELPPSPSFQAVEAPTETKKVLPSVRKETKVVDITQQEKNYAKRAKQELEQLEAAKAKSKIVTAVPGVGVVGTTVAKEQLDKLQERAIYCFNNSGKTPEDFTPIELMALLQGEGQKKLFNIEGFSFALASAFQKLWESVQSLYRADEADYQKDLMSYLKILEKECGKGFCDKFSSKIQNINWSSREKYLAIEGELLDNLKKIGKDEKSLKVQLRNLAANHRALIEGQENFILEKKEFIALRSLLNSEGVKKEILPEFISALQKVSGEVGFWRFFGNESPIEFIKKHPEINLTTIVIAFNSKHAQTDDLLNLMLEEKADQNQQKAALLALVNRPLADEQQAILRAALKQNPELLKAFDLSNLVNLSSDYYSNLASLLIAVYPKISAENQIKFANLIEKIAPNLSSEQQFRAYLFLTRHFAKLNDDIGRVAFCLGKVARRAMQADLIGSEQQQKIHHEIALRAPFDLNSWSNLFFSMLSTAEGSFEWGWSFLFHPSIIKELNLPDNELSVDSAKNIFFQLDRLLNQPLPTSEPQRDYYRLARRQAALQLLTSDVFRNHLGLISEYPAARPLLHTLLYGYGAVKYSRLNGETLANIVTPLLISKYPAAWLKTLAYLNRKESLNQLNITKGLEQVETPAGEEKISATTRLTLAITHALTENHDKAFALLSELEFEEINTEVLSEAAKALIGSNRRESQEILNKLIKVLVQRGDFSQYLMGDDLVNLVNQSDLPLLRDAIKKDPALRKKFTELTSKSNLNDNSKILLEEILTTDLDLVKKIQEEKNQLELLLSKAPGLALKIVKSCDLQIRQAAGHLEQKSEHLPPQIIEFLKLLKNLIAIKKKSPGFRFTPEMIQEAFSRIYESDDEEEFQSLNQLSEFIAGYCHLLHEHLHGVKDTELPKRISELSNNILELIEITDDTLLERPDDITRQAFFQKAQPHYLALIGRIWDKKEFGGITYHQIEAWFSKVVTRNAEMKISQQRFDHQKESSGQVKTSVILVTISSPELYVAESLAKAWEEKRFEPEKFILVVAEQLEPIISIASAEQLRKSFANLFNPEASQTTSRSIKQQAALQALFNVYENNPIFISDVIASLDSATRNNLIEIYKNSSISLSPLIQRELDLLPYKGLTKAIRENDQTIISSAIDEICAHSSAASEIFRSYPDLLQYFSYDQFRIFMANAIEGDAIGVNLINLRSKISHLAGDAATKPAAIAITKHFLRYIGERVATLDTLPNDLFSIEYVRFIISNGIVPSNENLQNYLLDAYVEKIDANEDNLEILAGLQEYSTGSLLNLIENLTARNKPLLAAAILKIMLSNPRHVSILMSDRGKKEKLANLCERLPSLSTADFESAAKELSQDSLDPVQLSYARFLRMFALSEPAVMLGSANVMRELISNAAPFVSDDELNSIRAEIWASLFSPSAVGLEALKRIITSDTVIKKIRGRWDDLNLIEFVNSLESITEIYSGDNLTLSSEALIKAVEKVQKILEFYIENNLIDPRSLAKHAGKKTAIALLNITPPLFEADLSLRAKLMKTAMTVTERNFNRGIVIDERMIKRTELLGPAEDKLAKEFLENWELYLPEWDLPPAKAANFYRSFLDASFWILTNEALTRNPDQLYNLVVVAANNGLTAQGFRFVGRFNDENNSGNLPRNFSEALPGFLLNYNAVKSATSVDTARKAIRNDFPSLAKVCEDYTTRFLPTDTEHGAENDAITAIDKMENVIHASHQHDNSERMKPVRLTIIRAVLSSPQWLITIAASSTNKYEDLKTAISSSSCEIEESVAGQNPRKGIPDELLQQSLAKTYARDSKTGKEKFSWRQREQILNFLRDRNNFTPHDIEQNRLLQRYEEGVKRDRNRSRFWTGWAYALYYSFTQRSPRKEFSEALSTTFVDNSHLGLPEFAIPAHDLIGHTGLTRSRTIAPIASIHFSHTTELGSTPVFHKPAATTAAEYKAAAAPKSDSLSLVYEKHGLVRLKALPQRIITILKNDLAMIDRTRLESKREIKATQSDSFLDKLLQFIDKDSAADAQEARNNAAREINSIKIKFFNEHRDDFKNLEEIIRNFIKRLEHFQNIFLIDHIDHQQIERFRTEIETESDKVKAAYKQFDTLTGKLKQMVQAIFGEEIDVTFDELFQINGKDIASKYKAELDKIADYLHAETKSPQP